MPGTSEIRCTTGRPRHPPHGTRRFCRFIKAGQDEQQRGPCEAKDTGRAHGDLSYQCRCKVTSTVVRIGSVAKSPLEFQRICDAMGTVDSGHRVAQFFLILFVACSPASAAIAQEPSIERLLSKLPAPEKFAKSPPEHALRQPDPVLRDQLAVRFALAARTGNLSAALSLSQQLANRY